MGNLSATLLCRFILLDPQWTFFLNISHITKRHQGWWPRFGYQIWFCTGLVMGTSLNHLPIYFNICSLSTIRLFDLIGAIGLYLLSACLEQLMAKSIDHLPTSYSGARTAWTDPCYGFVLVDGYVLAGHTGPWAYHVYWCNESMVIVAKCYFN